MWTVLGIKFIRFYEEEKMFRTCIVHNRLFTRYKLIHMKKATKAILEDKEEDLKAALPKIQDINGVPFIIFNFIQIISLLFVIFHFDFFLWCSIFLFYNSTI